MRQLTVVLLLTGVVTAMSATTSAHASWWQKAIAEQRRAEKAQKPKPGSVLPRKKKELPKQ